MTATPEPPNEIASTKDLDLEEPQDWSQGIFENRHGRHPGGHSTPVAVLSRKPACPRQLISRRKVLQPLVNHSAAAVLGLGDTGTSSVNCLSGRIRNVVSAPSINTPIATVNGSC